MSIDLKCPVCGQLFSAGDDAAGGIIRCPGCGNDLQVAVGREEALSARQEAPVGSAAPSWDILASIKRVGIFNIIVGCLSFLWAMLMLIEVFAARSGFLHKYDPNLPPVEEMLVIFLSLLVFSLMSGAIQFLAGILILQRKNFGRVLGLISGFLSCFTFWTCFVYPFCLASGIYTLIILFKSEVRDFFISGRQFPPF